MSVPPEVFKKTMKKRYKAEWLPEIQLYRIYDPEQLHQTITHSFMTDIDVYAEDLYLKHDIVLDIEGE